MGRTLIGSLAAITNKTPIPYVSKRTTLAFPWTSQNNAEAQMRAMGAVGTLFAIVTRLANATGQVEWKLYRKQEDGRRRYAGGEPVDTRREVTRHAALDLWNKPNPFMPQNEFIEATEQHIDLTGEGWWVIARNPRSSLPLELWPVRPDRMAPVPSPTDFIKGYVYSGPEGEQVPLEPKDVIQLRMPNPLDPYRGMGPVQSILTDLDSTKYSAEWNRNFFLNSAQPGGIVQVDRRLSDDEFDEMTSRWREQHQGVAQAHRVAVLENATWIDRKYTQQDMQFSQLRDSSREIIREAFGFPKPMLGATDDVNRANADAAEVVFSRWLLIPRLERIKQALNTNLLPLFGPTGQGVEFDYVNPVPNDREADNEELTSRSNAASVLVAAGWEAKAVLETVGLPAMPYKAPAVPPPPPPPVVPPAEVAPAARLDIHHHATPAVGGDSGQSWSLYDVARAQRSQPHAQDDTPTVSPELEAVRADFEAALTGVMTAWDGIEAAWHSDLAEQIRTAVDAGDTGALAALAVAAGPAADVLRGALAGMAEQAAARIVEEAAAQGVTVTAPPIDESLRNVWRPRQLRAAFGADLAGVALATAQLLASGVAAAAGREALRLFRPGADGAGVADSVMSALQMLKTWARRDQLGGALHRAQNTGRLAALGAAPSATYTATEVLDGNTCEPCAKESGTQFADLAAAEETYGGGGYVLCEGGIRCRGTVVATWDTTGDGQ